jgi:hypothetical protein
MRVVPPNSDLPDDIILMAQDSLLITLKFTGVVNVTNTYDYTAQEPVRIQLKHFDIVYPDDHLGGQVEFTTTIT